MNRKILLINRGADTDNLGDKAINYTLVRLLENKNCSVSSENYTKLLTFRGSKIKSLICNLVSMIRTAKREYDAVLIGGGQLILSNKKFPVSFLSWILIIKTFSRSKIILFGVGVVSDYSRMSKLLFKTGIKFVDRIYVRDEHSKNNLIDQFNRGAAVIPDVVTVISRLYSPNKYHTTAGYVLFGITNYSSIKKYGYIAKNEGEYLAKKARLLLDLPAADNKILICNTESDRLYANRFKKFMKQNYNYDIDIYHAEGLMDYLDLISSSKMVISSRMHALIIALSFNIDVLPVIRNRKLAYFTEEYIPFDRDNSYMETINRRLDEVIDMV